MYSSRISFTPFVLVVLMTLVLPACGGGGSSDSDDDAVDDSSTLSSGDDVDNNNDSTDQTDTDQQSPATSASPAGGSYSANQSVTLSSDEPATVYYTTDGSTPDTGSTVYTVGVSITSSTTLKFFAVDAAGNSSEVTTETYSINKPPVITSSNAFSIPENTLVVATVAASDPEALTVSYSLSGSDDDALFSIDSGSGLLQLLSTADFEIPGDGNTDNDYQLTLSVSDGVHVTTQAITVTITDDVADNILTGVLNIDFNTVGYVIDRSSAGASASDGGLDRVFKMAVSGNSIYAAGTGAATGSDSDMLVWKYTTGGSLDTGFSGDGRFVHNNAAGGDGFDHGRAITIDGDGKILVAGDSWSLSNSSDATVWRLNTDGTLDTTFGGGDGIVTFDNPSANNADTLNAIGLDSSGNIYVTGNTRTGPLASDFDMILIRFDSDGDLDTTFNSVGYVTHDNAAGGSNRDEGLALVVDASGNVVVAGRSNAADGYSDMTIWKYSSTGVLVSGFGSGGFVTFNGGVGSNDVGWDMEQDASGNLYIAGYISPLSNYDIAVWKYDDEGNPVTTFDSDGMVTHHDAAGGNGSDSAGAIALDATGNIYVAGNSARSATLGDDAMAIWKFTSAGVLDTSFGGDGIVVHDGAAGGSSTDTASGIGLDPSGYLYVGGYSDGGITGWDMAIWSYR